MSIRGRLERVASYVLSVAAIIMALVVVRREYFLYGEQRSLAGRSAEQRAASIHVPNWEELLTDAVVIGGTGNTMHVVEFVDLECPFCARYHEFVLKPLLQTYGDAVTVSMLHLPLQMHRFASTAAVAAECAGEQGRFSAFVEVALAGQASFPSDPWWQLAQAALVPDSAQFATCLAAPPSPRIAAGIRRAETLSITGTPTVLVNGRRFRRPPSVQDLVGFLEGLGNGVTPF